MKEPKIFLIGDCHFGHRNIIKYCNRPFKDVEDMNEQLIKNWNSVVGKNDTVYVVGDFALCGKQKIIEIGQRLNGRKRLVLGNHDQASVNTYREAGLNLYIIILLYLMIFTLFLIFLWWVFLLMLLLLIFSHTFMTTLLIRIVVAAVFV